jgi:hypothetical protein
MGPLKWITTEGLLDLCEWLVSQPYEDGFDTLLDEAFLVLLNRFDMATYQRVVGPLEAARKHPNTDPVWTDYVTE